MIKIRGASDDLVEIYGSCYREDEIGCFDADVRIRFWMVRLFGSAIQRTARLFGGLR